MTPGRPWWSNRFLDANGETRWLRDQLTKLDRTDADSEFVVYVTDITDEYMVRLRLQQSERMVTLGLLTTNIAHEIKPAACRHRHGCPERSPGARFLHPRGSVRRPCRPRETRRRTGPGPQQAGADHRPDQPHRRRDLGISGASASSTTTPGPRPCTCRKIVEGGAACSPSREWSQPA